MSKPFDNINHYAGKLKAIGLASSAISWFNSYLSQRSQVVGVNAALSDALPVTCRVPQGSLLGALLFSIIIIQQIVTLSKYGHDALDICHP